MALASPTFACSQSYATGLIITVSRHAVIRTLARVDYIRDRMLDQNAARRLLLSLAYRGTIHHDPSFSNDHTHVLCTREAVLNQDLYLPSLFDRSRTSLLVLTVLLTWPRQRAKNVA